MFDWRHEVDTTDPALLQVDAVDLPAALQGRAGVPQEGARSTGARADKTVLANEQVIDGCCERLRTPRSSSASLEQWFFRITDYAERLLDNLDTARLVGVHTNGAAQLDRPERRAPSSVFATPAGETRSRVFTTRPDTVFGATYMVLAPEHPLVDALTAAEQRADGATPTARRSPRRTSSRARSATGEDRRLHRRRTPATRRPARRSRSGSPTTC